MALGSRQTDSITILAGEALPAFTRVYFNGTAWFLAGAGQQHHAITAYAIANGETGTAWPANGSGVFPIQAAGAIAAGSFVYGAASGECNDVGTAGCVDVGLCLGAAADSADCVNVLLGCKRPGGLVYSVTTPDTTDGTTTNETFFTNSYSIAANSLKEGDVIRIRGAITIANSQGADTMTPKVYLGTENLLVTGAAPDAVNADLIVFDIEVTVRTLGAAGTFYASVVASVDADATGDPAVVRGVAEFTEDTTGALVIRASSTWTGGHADDDARLDQFDITIQRA